MSASRNLTALGLACAVTVGLGSAQSADAQDKMRIGHIYSSTHYIQTELVTPFVEELVAKSNGQLTVEQFPAGQLGKNTPSLLSTGLLDIGLFGTGHHADLFPLSSVAELPMVSQSACETNARMNRLTLPGGILDQLEFAPQGLRVLASHSLPPYRLFFSKALKSVDDLAGRKIWASGPTADIALRSLGSVPIHVSSPELYDAVTRGTIDGVLIANSSVLLYDLGGPLANSIDGITMGTGVFYTTVKQDAWEDLTPEMQTLLSEQALASAQKFCEYVDTANARDYQRLNELPTTNLVKLEEQEKAQFVEKLLAVGDIWATKFNDAGLQGTAVLEAFVKPLD